MRKRFLILLALPVTAAGFFLGRTSANATRAEGAQLDVLTKCTISKNYGSFKTVVAYSDGTWMVFEDSGGTIRYIDAECRVRLKINRE